MTEATAKVKQKTKVRFINVALSEEMFAIVSLLAEYNGRSKTKQIIFAIQEQAERAGLFEKRKLPLPESKAKKDKSANDLFSRPVS